MTTNGPLKISELSTEYLKVTVTSNLDPTDFAPFFAFMPSLPGDEPTEDDWYEARWTDDLMYEVRILVGPPQLPLPVGRYEVWVRYQLLTEHVVEKIDMLEVY